MPFAARHHFSAASVLASLILPGTLGMGIANAQASPQRPPITGIAHISIAAQNMDASRNFYTHSLGWTAVASPEFPGGLRFYGDPRQTVEVHPATSTTGPMFDHVAFKTTDANALRLYMKSKGVTVPDAVKTLRDGEKEFLVHDPEGNAIEFVQHMPGLGKQPSNAPDSISGRIIHAGFIVKSAPAEDSFFKDILGFKLYWTGGMKDGQTDFLSMQVPDGHDWIEYMLNVGPNPSHHQIGVSDHFSLGVANMDATVARFQQRGFPAGGQTQKQAGRDGKFQLNEYDPDGVRVEFMEFTPANTPCCHAFVSPHPSANDPE